MGVSVSIEVDDPVRVGDRVEATVVVLCEDERAVDAITLTLVGTATTWRSDRLVTESFLTAMQEVAGASTLRAGAQRFRGAFQLSADVPPSCEAGDVSIHYELQARVHIPWRLDPRAAAPVRVLAKLAAPRGEPQRATSTIARSGNDLFLELSLDDTRWAPGEAITGAFSIGNVGAMRLDGATVALTAFEDSIALAVPGTSSVFKSLVGASEGSVVRFAIPIPKDTPPSFTSRVGDVKRAVALHVDGATTECHVPVLIDDFEPRATAHREPGEAVGGARWRTMWREEGARLGLSLARHELLLEGDLAGDITLAVQPRGNGLAAELRWESLGIGLSVDKRGVFPLSGVDLYRVSPAFADRFAAHGREEAQVRAVLDAQLCEAIAAFTTAKLNDHRARVSLDAPARDAEGLRRLLAAVEALALAVADASRRVPPPSWVSDADAAAWRYFAAAAGGTLRCGSMAVRGAIVDAERVDIATLLDDDGHPEATRVVLALDPAIELRDPPDMPPPIAAAARAVARDPGRAPSLDVTAEKMTVVLGGFTPDPAALRPLIAQMGLLAARLRGEGTRGPYR